MAKPKQKTFTVNYKIDGFYEATIKADSLEEALEKAKQMSVDQLHDTPGGVLDEECRIVGVFE